VAQALWGLGKWLLWNTPNCGRNAFSPEATEDEATKLLAEIDDSQREDNLAFRDGQRYVARLVKQLQNPKY